MTSPTPTNPEPVGMAPEKTSTPAPSERLRRWWPLAGGAVLAVVGVVALVISLDSGGSSTAGTRSTATFGQDPDRTSPTAVATRFLARYAVHDPAACVLAMPRLRTTLEVQGRCAGKVTSPAPVISILFGPVVCGKYAGVGAQIIPAEQAGGSYAFVGVDSVNGTWAVASVLPLADRSQLTPYSCDAPSPDDGG